MKKNYKRRVTPAKIITSVGLILKIVQVIGTACKISFMGSFVFSLIAIIFLAAGLFVLGTEIQGIGIFFAFFTSALSCTTLMKTADNQLTFLSFFLFLISFAILLITKNRKNKILAGAVSLVITALLFLIVKYSILTYSPLITFLIVADYAVLGAGLYV